MDLKSSDVLSVTALECDVAKLDTLSKQITTWNVCGPKYNLQVSIDCNGWSMEPEVCAAGSMEGYGMYGCVAGCASLNLDLHDRY